MVNHYNILVDVGFLRDTVSQFRVAQTNLQQDLMMDESDSLNWYFNPADKKADFDYYYEEIGLCEFVAEHLKTTIKDEDDVLIINTPKGYIYCGYRKKEIVELAIEGYNQEGLLPYYTTKRKIGGKIVWFCLAWTTIPFDPPNYN